MTYLLEKPAEDGSFRYIRYFGTDYSKPNEPVPLSADFSFWEIPADYVSRGFDRVDAVSGEGDDLILIRGGEFINHDAVTGKWSVPRHLALRWPGLIRHYPDFETIQAVVHAPDQKTWFFAEKSWVIHDDSGPSPLSPIPSRWGIVRNRITQSNRVDATLVYGDQTFLFSGDQYVRYTGSEYEYVDQGYPQPIAGFLRREAPFKQLPDEVETLFEGLKPEDVWINAAFSAGGVVVVSVAGSSYALSARLSRRYPLEQVARVRNELLRRARVDAAFSRGQDGALLLLSGDQYVRYSHPELDLVDDGYPRAIADSLLGELTGSRAELPLTFQQDLDAAIYEDSGTLVLFKGKQFVRSEANPPGQALVPMDIKGTWGRVSNPFLPSPADPQPRLDAAFVAPDHSLYVFKGGQYLRYTDPTAEFVDEGYPRAIGDEWADLPDAFRTGIDGAFLFDGRTYVCQDGQYVRYGDSSYRRMDPIYPQFFSNRWRASNDFLLGDLRTIQRYVALDQSHPSDGGSLTDFLLAGTGDNADPHAMLATLFDWQVGDVEWLKRRDAFLDRPSRDLSAQVNFDLAQVIRIYTTLELCRRLGSHPQELYELVWIPLYADHRDPTSAADTLERLLGTLYPGDDWRRIQRQLGDALSRLLRDAQLGWLLAHSPGNLEDARALSDVLLTDVEVDSSLDTSPIVEAIGAIQLYFHRYLTNLEPGASRRRRCGAASQIQGAVALASELPGLGGESQSLPLPRVLYSARTAKLADDRVSIPAAKPATGRTHQRLGYAGVQEIPGSIHRGIAAHYRRRLRLAARSRQTRRDRADAVRLHPHRSAALLLSDRHVQRGQRFEHRGLAGVAAVGHRYQLRIASIRCAPSAGLSSSGPRPSRLSPMTRRPLRCKPPPTATSSRSPDSNTSNIASRFSTPSAT